MTILEAVIQGVIQGATEFLPVSSSGHLSISQHIFGIELPGILFDIMLLLGTLVAGVWVSWGVFGGVRSVVGWVCCLCFCCSCLFQARI